MKIGIITDIHNNLIALSKILQKFNDENCDKIICCGDIIGIGPEPEQTVQMLMKIPNLIAVKGNHDRYFVEEMPNATHMSLGEMEHHKWEHSILSKESFNFLKDLPYSINCVIDGVTITVVHYAINSSNKYINYTPTPNIDDCYRMFSNIKSDVVIYGHDHERSINTDGKRLFINCGSLGCPSKDRNIARGGILKVSKGCSSFEIVELQYDVNSVIEMIDRLNYPEANIIKTIFYGVK